MRASNILSTPLLFLKLKNEQLQLIFQFTMKTAKNILNNVNY